MKRLATYTLVAVLSLAGTVQILAQDAQTDETYRRYAKEHRKDIKKAEKQQRKAMKKYEKAQRKAAKRARHHSI